MTEKSEGKKHFEHIFKPIKIGPIELKNRIVMAPMNEALSGAHGEVGEQYIAYFGARAKGGTGLITTGAIMGTKLAGEFPAGRNPHLYHQGHMIGMTNLTDRIHYFGSRVAAQMTIGFGRQGHSYDHHALAPAATGGLPYEISAEKSPNHVSDLYGAIEYTRYFMTGPMTREMSIEEIRSEQKEFAQSCQMAVICGFDAIEIHGPHGYLEHQFLSPLSNKRTDIYGGEWRNRKRFLMEVAEQIRYACPGIAVGCRISAEEHMQGGLTEEEMIDVAKDLEAIGLDYISLSDGAGYEEGGHLITDMDRSRHIPEHGEAFKKALKIPVVVSSQHDPVKIDKNIAEGKYDLQAMGRQLYCDPEYVNKLAAGKAKEIVRCSRCNTCLMRFLAALTPACPQNPNLGREYAMDEYRIGPWQKHESVIPEGMMRASMPSLDRPWWKNELGYIDKSWRPLQGRTPR